MMATSVAAASGPVAPTVSIAAPASSSQLWRSLTPLDLEQPHFFTLTQRYFFAAGEVLVLEKFPQLAVYPGKLEFEIVGWGLRMPYGSQAEIGREMLRKFLHLYAKAERLELSEHEEAEWSEIVRQVDYKRFCINRSQPRYIEGRLFKRKDGVCTVEWHDGSKERVVGDVATPLSLLDDGEYFSGLARFGDNNVLRELVNLTPRPGPEDDEGERMWRSWPINES